MEADSRAVVRMHARHAGLDLVDERLDALADGFREFGQMMEAVERMDIDPLDLALESFDPAWTETERAR